MGVIKRSLRAYCIIDPVTGCWNWRYAKTQKNSGYGNVRYKGKRWIAHRLAWALANGPIPKGLLVCHHCDNPSCCNPEHLFVGTAKENSQDASRKGRLNKPEWLKRKNFTLPKLLARVKVRTAAKLKKSDVLAIREIHATGRTIQTAIARKYGVTQGTISDIVNRKSWKYLW